MKGISTLIASVIVIAITIIVGGLFMNWATDILKSQQATASNKTEECRPGSDTSIEEVFIDISSNTSRVVIRNSGTDDQQVVGANMYNKRGQLMENRTVFPLTVVRGAISNLEFRLNNTVGNITACADFGKVIVTTRCTSTERDKFVKCFS